MAIYADNQGDPGALISKVDESTSIISGWNDIRIPMTAILKDDHYWLAVNSDASIVCFSNAQGSFCYKAASYNAFTFPDFAGYGFTQISSLTGLIAAGKNNELQISSTESQ